MVDDFSSSEQLDKRTITTIFLTLPTQICHWSHYYYRLYQTSPQTTESRVAIECLSLSPALWPYSFHYSLGFTGWQQLDIRSAISGHSRRQQQSKLLCLKKYEANYIFSLRKKEHYEVVCVCCHALLEVSLAF